MSVLVRGTVAVLGCGVKESAGGAETADLRGPGWRGWGRRAPALGWAASLGRPVRGARSSSHPTTPATIMRSANEPSPQAASSCIRAGNLHCTSRRGPVCTSRECGSHGTSGRCDTPPRCRVRRGRGDVWTDDPAPASSFGGRRRRGAAALAGAVRRGSGGPDDLLHEGRADRLHGALRARLLRPHRRPCTSPSPSPSPSPSRAPPAPRSRPVRRRSVPPRLRSPPPLRRPTLSAPLKRLQSRL